MTVKADLRNDDPEPPTHARQYMGVRLRVLGSSPAWPNPGQAHAGYVIAERLAEGPRLLLECGPGVLSRLREHELLPVETTVISHLHLDHWGDLVPWCWLAQHRPESGALGTELWLPPGAAARLAQFARLFGREDMFTSTFAVREYAPERPFRAAGFEIEAYAVPHFNEPTFALRVQGADGRALAFSADSAPSEVLTRVARSADLFVCEATLASAADEGTRGGHLSAEEAVALAGPTRLLLTHRPAELAPPPGVEVARDGLELSIG